MTENNSGNELDGYENLIALLNVTITEWVQRDTYLWKKSIQLYFVSIVIMLLPAIQIGAIKVAIDIPSKVFYMVGALVSFMFLYIAYGSVLRQEGVAKSYRNYLGMLPKEYKPVHILNERKGFWGRSINRVSTIVMFASLMIIDVTLFIFG